MAFRPFTNGEQAADSSRSLWSAAKVEAPDEITLHRVSSIQFGHEIPAVIKKAQILLENPCCATAFSFEGIVADHVVGDGDFHGGEFEDRRP